MAYSSKPTRVEDNIYRVANRDGSISYLVRVIDRTGRWFPQKSFKTKREARSYRLQLMCERDAGSLAPSPEKKLLTVGEFWNMWAKERRAKVSNGWRMSQDQMFRDHVLPYLGKLKLLNIAPKHIGDLMFILNNKGLADQTQRHVFNMLAVVFKEAIEHYEFLEASPVKKRYQPKVGKKPQEALTPDEAITLVRAAPGSLPWSRHLACSLCGFESRSNPCS
ncbi:MAG: hypothetical protein H6618_06750 [Deltaproteobacteria bacterium]|nr:hypothetical protein [Deltaproteobacteria bacterium]